MQPLFLVKAGEIRIDEIQKIRYTDGGISKVSYRFCGSACVIKTG